MTDGRHVFYCLVAVVALVIGAGFTVYPNATDAACVGVAIAAVFGTVWYFSTRQPK